MAIASKETLEAAFKHDEFKRAVFDQCVFGKGFIEFGLRGVKHLRIEDVITPWYQSAISTYKAQSHELRHATQLEF